MDYKAAKTKTQNDIKQLEQSGNRKKCLKGWCLIIVSYPGLSVCILFWQRHLAAFIHVFSVNSEK